MISYASIIEHETLAQAYATASLDVVKPYLALMPDAHLGRGATVGSVIPTMGAIIPAAVGVDIGCGMVALRLNLHGAEIRASGLDLDTLRQLIEDQIPLSAGRYNTWETSSVRQRADYLENLDGADSAYQVSPNWRLQLGSLGSGNHFIEVSLDENDRVWLFLHSGSRGVGNKLAQRHIKVAENYIKDAGIRVPNRDLSYLEEGTRQFDEYIRDLRWAQEFARLNRAEMMTRVFAAAESWWGSALFEQEMVECHHNYTEREMHQGDRVWLSRKGAIDAHTGVRGLIPGSMGAASYVVRGLGNTEALCSAPHGAGRNYSRSKAKRMFDMDDLTERMEGVSWRHTDAFLDEHPLAYKDIDRVMEDAASLVRSEHILHQIVNVKGD
jgi:tRNA-splicing ligase RtcB